MKRDKKGDGSQTICLFAFQPPDAAARLGEFYCIPSSWKVQVM